MEFERIKQAIGAAQNITLIAHLQPDGDTLGSCFALKEMLCDMGKDVAVCCDGDMTSRYAALFSPHTLLAPQSAPESIDLAVAVDCADSVRLGKCHKLFKRAKTTANIDHHSTNDHYAQINYVTDASSVGEIIFEFMRDLDMTPNENMAKFLYTAMSTDTGNFTYSNTSKKVLLYTSELVELFDLRGTADILFRQRSLLSTQLMGRALSRMELFKDGRIACLTLLDSDMKEFGAGSADCENIVEVAREIEETQVAVLFRELPAGVKISFRSKGSADVGALAALYGGGGHAAASGCVTGGKLDEVKKSVLDKLTEMVD